MVCSATTLRDGLQWLHTSKFRLAASLRDEQGHLRPSVGVFVDGRRCTERVLLADVVARDSTVCLLQALSGG